ELLRPGVPAPAPPLLARRAACAPESRLGPQMTTDFQNHPLLELRRAEVRQELTGALAALDRELPLAAEVVIDGQGRDGEEVASVDPCSPEREVARLAWATEEEGARALELALEARWA